MPLQKKPVQYTAVEVKLNEADVGVHGKNTYRDGKGLNTIVNGLTVYDGQVVLSGSDKSTVVVTKEELAANFHEVAVEVKK